MPDKIEVGEYIRTKNGCIKEVSRFHSEDEDLKDIVKCKNGGCWLQDIVKHSKNLIDLIEVGDLVEYKENRTFLATIKGTSYLETYITDIHNEEELEIFRDEVNNKKVKLISILTKQQYEKNCFRVGE